MVNQRVRRFALTFNNYTEPAVEALKAHAGDVFKYLIWSRETGELLTPHLQMYGETTNKLTILGLKTKLTAIHDSFHTVHVEVAGGTAQQNIEYCTKTSEAEFELGTRPRGQGKRTDLDTVCDAIQSGATFDQVIKLYPTQFVKFGNGLSSLIMHVSPPRNSMTIGYWCYGETGAGKSHWAHQNFPMAYWKSCDEKWFDGYTGQETVVIDDYRPTKEMSLQFILRLVDKYPLRVPVKGAYVQFAPKRIIFTSPKDISGTFSHLEWIGDENILQLVRRFPLVLHFNFHNSYNVETLESNLDHRIYGTSLEENPTNPYADRHPTRPPPAISPLFSNYQSNRTNLQTSVSISSTPDASLDGSRSRTSSDVASSEDHSRLPGLSSEGSGLSSY